MEIEINRIMDYIMTQIKASPEWETIKSGQFDVDVNENGEITIRTWK